MGHEVHVRLQFGLRDLPVVDTTGVVPASVIIHWVLPPRQRLDVSLYPRLEDLHA